jgi:hypothetical protein
LRTAWASQPKSAESQNALEMGEQHLDALAITAGLLERLGFGQCTGDIAGVFMMVARNLPRGSVGTALHFERTDIAIKLGGPIAKRIGRVSAPHHAPSRCSGRRRKLGISWPSPVSTGEGAAPDP